MENVKKESHESILLRAIKNKDYSIWNKWRSDNLRTIANLRRCNLEKIDFSNLYLDNVNFTNSILKRSKFVDIYLNKSIFDDANLYGATFKKAAMKSTKFHNSKCEHTSFEGAILNNVQVNSGNFNKANFSEATLPLAKITGGATFKEANFISAHLENSIIDSSHFIHAIFHEAFLSHAKITNSIFQNAEFIGANLSGTEVTKTTFENTNFSKANLHDCKLIGVNLENSDLSYANCSGVDLTGANLIKARLAGTNFNGAILTGIKINLMESTINNQTNFDSVICEYIEINKDGMNERYPKDRNFNDGEFIQLISNLLKSFEFVLNKEENSNIFILLLLKSEIYIKDIILNGSDEITVILNIPEGKDAAKIRQKFNYDYNTYSQNQNLLKRDLLAFDQDTIDIISTLTSQLKQTNNNDSEQINEIKSKLNDLIQNLNKTCLNSNDRTTLFISYCHKDRDKITKICNKIKEYNSNIIIDIESLKSGEDIQEFIQNSVNVSDFTISVISKNSLLSPWVITEALETLSTEKSVNRKKLLPVYIDNDIFDDNLLVDIGNEINNSMTKLLELTNKIFQQGLDTELYDLKRSKLFKLKSNISHLLTELYKRNTLDFTNDEKINKNVIKIMGELNISPR